MNTYFVDKLVKTETDIVVDRDIQPREIKDYLYDYFMDCSKNNIQVDISYMKSIKHEFTKIEDTCRNKDEKYDEYAKRVINVIIRDVIQNREFESIHCFVHENDKPDILILFDRNILGKISKSKYYKIETDRYRKQLEYNKAVKVIDYTPYINIAKDVVEKETK